MYFQAAFILNLSQFLLISLFYYDMFPREGMFNEVHYHD